MLVRSGPTKCADDGRQGSGPRPCVGLLGVSRAPLAATAVALLCSGCVMYLAPVAEDHTVGLISRPVSAPVELLWRCKTIGEESAERLRVKILKFRRLEELPIKDVDPTRPHMAGDVMHDWLASRVGPCVRGDVRLLTGGEAFFSRFELALWSARQRIDIQTYIFDNDDVAVHVADILRAKSREIPVRVLLDALGSRHAWTNSAPSARSVLQPPVHDMVHYLRARSFVRVRRRRNLWLSANHSKLMVIDGQTAFLGGMNIGREYRHDWRDMMVEIHGPLVQRLERRFERSWNRARFFSDFFLLREWQAERAARDRQWAGACFHLLTTTPFHHTIYDAQLRAARKARNRIYVENSYLWNDRFIYALCAARRRGVDVRVTVPLEIDIEAGTGANLVALNTLLRHSVRVFLYPGMTHVKAAVFDGWACFGSANYDDLSLHKNIEVNLCTGDDDFVRGLVEELLLQGQDASTEITKPLPLTLWDELAAGLADFL